MKLFIYVATRHVGVFTLTAVALRLNAVYLTFPRTNQIKCFKIAIYSRLLFTVLARKDLQASSNTSEHFCRLADPESSIIINTDLFK